MKKLFFLLLILPLAMLQCKQAKKQNTSMEIVSKADTADLTNDFYDNAESYSLVMTPLEISGEIKNPGPVNFKTLPKRSVIVKESNIDGNSDQFRGAYRYDGYSLYDILNERIPHKKNADEFNPIIDLYVIVENDKGEKVVISWGEIYYPVHQHEIIIASEVMRIVPSKTRELWPLPDSCRLICASDLITERNISNPVKITVVSYNIDIPVKKGLKPLHDDELSIYNKDQSPLKTLKKIPESLQTYKYNTVFYGRGRGIHKSKSFKGVLIKNLIKDHLAFNRENLREGLIVFTAPDGYRAVFTISEIINRNDQSELILQCDPDLKDGGIFRIFPSSDFFSDRAVKSVNGIIIDNSDL